MNTGDSKSKPSATVLTQLIIVVIFFGVGGWAATQFIVAGKAKNKAVESVEVSTALPVQRVRMFPTTSPYPSTIDLLKSIDVPKAIVNGTWMMKDGSLNSDAGRGTRIDFGYRPAREYDLRLNFTRLTGDDGMDVVLCVDGRQFTWTIAGWSNTTNGFGSVMGAMADVNETTTHSQSCITNGQRYTLLLKVRRAKVEAYLDDQLISQLKTDFDDVALFADRRLHRTDTIGVSTWESCYAIHAAEVTEIAGRGKIVTGAEPLEATPIAVWNYTVATRAPAPYTLFSNGHVLKPDGVDTWYLRGNTIYFQFAGGWVDRCKLSQDHRTFTGRNQIGDLISGTLINGSLW